MTATTFRQMTARSVEAAPALEFPEPAQPAEKSTKPVTLTLSAVLDGYPLTVTCTGSVDQLPAIIGRLRSLGATPPSTRLEWSYTPEGLPICSKHGTPMKKRERQGDTWYSHNMGTTDEPCYCRGYAGADSPGWER
jgi:hypothetical protein